MTSHQVAVEMRVFSQATHSITTVLECEGRSGSSHSKKLAVPKTGLAGIRTQGLGGDFIQFSFCHILPCLGSSQATFYHLFCLLGTSIDLSQMGPSDISFLSYSGDLRTPADDSHHKNPDQKRGDERSSFVYFNSLKVPLGLSC